MDNVIYYLIDIICLHVLFHSIYYEKLRATLKPRKEFHGLPFFLRLLGGFLFEITFVNSIGGLLFKMNRCKY